MPKMKTKKAVVKRFRKTANGKLKFGRPHRGHLLGGKSRTRKRHLRKVGVLHASEQKRLGNTI